MTDEIDGANYAVQWPQWSPLGESDEIIDAVKHMMTPPQWSPLRESGVTSS